MNKYYNYMKTRSNVFPMLKLFKLIAIDRL